MNVTDEMVELAKAWRDEANEPRFPAEEDRDAVEAYDKALNRCADELDAKLAALLPSAADEPVAWEQAHPFVNGGVACFSRNPLSDESRAAGFTERPLVYGIRPQAQGSSRPASARPSAGVEGVLQHVESNLSALFASGDYTMPQDVLDFGLGILADLKNRIGDDRPAPVAPAAERMKPRTAWNAPHKWQDREREAWAEGYNAAAQPGVE